MELVDDLRSVRYMNEHDSLGNPTLCITFAFCSVKL